MGAPDQGSIADAFDAFVEARVQPQYRAIVERFCAQVREVAPEATLRMRGGTEKYYSVPVFRVVRDVVAISPSKTGITFSFARGADFDDPAGILGGAGKKTRTVKVTRDDQYPEAEMASFIRQAVELDRN